MYFDKTNKDKTNKNNKFQDKKELDKDKEDVQLEKNDFLAISIALASYMIPIVLAIFACIFLLTWIIF